MATDTRPAGARQSGILPADTQPVRRPRRETPADASVPAASVSPTPACISTPAPTSAAGTAEALAACQACGLYRERRQALWGKGSLPCRVLFVSEGIAPEDDAAATLLSGQTGVLFDAMLEAIGLSRQEVFVTAAVKCAANLTITPKAEHLNACAPHFNAQLTQSQSRAVVLLGQFTPPEIWNLSDKTVLTLPHPARLLQEPAQKAAAWKVLKQLRRLLQPPAS